MDANDIDNLLRRWRRKPLWSLVTEGVKRQELQFSEAELQKLLPHRSPFLLCRELRCFAGVGISESPVGMLLGQSYITPVDPVFQGHFPDFPVYPGVLQLEMLGQLALCLGYFQERLELLDRGVVIEAPQEPQAMNIRASKVLGAHYLHPVLPGQTAELQACQLGQSDGLFAKMLGQLLVDGQVAMVCAQEVCFIDG